MNEEQNDPKTGSEADISSGNDSAAPGSMPNSNNDTAQPQDDYYAVDHAKKDVVSTIGDGEMHNEGLVGEGEAATTNFQSSTEQLSGEQDEAGFDLEE